MNEDFFTPIDCILTSQLQGKKDPPSELAEAAERILEGRSLSAYLLLVKTFGITGRDSVHAGAEGVGAAACLHRALHCHPLGPATSYYACSAYYLAECAVRVEPQPEMFQALRDAAVMTLAAVRHCPEFKPRFRDSMEPIRKENACQAEIKCREVGVENTGASDPALAVEQHVHRFMNWILQSRPLNTEDPTEGETCAGPAPDNLVSSEFCLWMMRGELNNQELRHHAHHQALTDGYQFMLRDIQDEASFIFRGLIIHAKTFEDRALYGGASRGALLSLLSLQLAEPERRNPRPKDIKFLLQLAEGHLKARLDLHARFLKVLAHLIAAIHLPDEARLHLEVARQEVDRILDQPDRPHDLNDFRLRLARQTLGEFFERYA